MRDCVELTTLQVALLEADGWVVTGPFDTELECVANCAGACPSCNGALQAIYWDGVDHVFAFGSPPGGYPYITYKSTASIGGGANPGLAFLWNSETCEWDFYGIDDTTGFDIRDANSDVLECTNEDANFTGTGTGDTCPEGYWQIVCYGIDCTEPGCAQVGPFTFYFDEEPSVVEGFFHHSCTECPAMHITFSDDSVVCDDVVGGSPGIPFPVHPDGYVITQHEGCTPANFTPHICEEAP